MATEAIQRAFLSSSAYAVVGASKDQSKYGSRVLKWYKQRSYKVTPVHPKESELEGIPTVASISDLPSPKETSVSIITPPKVTLSILKQAKDLSVPALWLQPGAEDAAVVEYIKNQGLSDRIIYGGPCILVEGLDAPRVARGLHGSSAGIVSNIFRALCNETLKFERLVVVGMLYLHHLRLGCFKEFYLCICRVDKNTHMTYAFAKHHITKSKFSEPGPFG
ncbi:hypothetical protein AX15_000064 [Amanita polypyramis BW_CC]|nr:hypothetical protein AX15_000064 [Amanita polypyramis BW_CC]